MKKYIFEFNQMTKTINARCMIRAIKKFKSENPTVKIYKVKEEIKLGALVLFFIGLINAPELNQKYFVPFLKFMIEL